MTVPPYLHHGDTIGLVCPSGFMPEGKYQACIDTLIKWGFNVKVGKTPGHQFHYFSGTDKQRAKDLQQMMDNPKIKAILCARGGYGMGRIIDRLDFSLFRQHPKWIIGFSDITVLHSHLFSKYQIASLHAPMAAAFNDNEFENAYVQSLRHALLGQKGHYQAKGNPLNQPGKAKGKLVGGNLSLLVNVIGTPSSIKMRNKILFIEEIGEYIYNVDRMMYQLLRSGALGHLKGLIIGSFSDMKDTTIPFGRSVENVIKDLVKPYQFPICFGFPVGHERENYALKNGVTYQLTVSKTQVDLMEV